MKITAEVRDGKTGKPVVSESVEIDIPTTLKEMIAKWGEEYVTHRARGAIIIDYQALMRSKMQDKKDEDGKVKTKGIRGKDLQAAINAHKPGVKRKGEGVVEKFKARMAKMSDAEKRALLKELQA